MSAPARQPIPGLRSPREEVDGLVYFGRMVDKIRLEQAGKLPPDYQENLGKVSTGPAVIFSAWHTQNCATGSGRGDPTGSYWSGVKATEKHEMRPTERFGAPI